MAPKTTDGVNLDVNDSESDSSFWGSRAVSVFGVLLISSVVIFALFPGFDNGPAPKRTMCLNNMRQLSLAIQNYQSANLHFPPAYTVDENGNRLHSWRTLILPYLEEQTLYDQIDFSKPWDHPENLKLALPVPSIFRCPTESRLASDDATTIYIGIIGDEMFWENDGAVRRYSDLDDGATQTVAIVESESNRVHWMSPDDLQYSDLIMQLDSGRKDLFTSGHPGGSNAAFADGSVQYIRDSLTAEEIKALFTINGGEKVDLD